VVEGIAAEAAAGMVMAAAAGMAVAVAAVSEDLEAAVPAAEEPAETTEKRKCKKRSHNQGRELGSG
jgi:hypothetical protein